MSDTDQHDAAVRLHVAWEEFCDDLKRNGQMMLRDATPRDAVTQAEGYRFLCRLLRSGLENGFEALRDPGVRFRDKDPYLHVGFTSPDQDPLTCNIDPTKEYRITGTRGTNAGLGILAMEPATMQMVGWLNHLNLKVDESGHFEIIASRNGHPGNWLRLTDRSGLLVIRCNYHDRKTETRAQFRIEEIGGTPDPRRPIGAEDVIRGLKLAKTSTSVMSWRMVEWAEELVARPNQINVLESYMRSSGSPDHNFRFGYFDLKPGEAIELKFVPPDCDNWQFQIGNWWVENLDNYEDEQGWINKFRAQPDSDGSITLYASPEKVAAPNWVDTFGRWIGVMGVRFIRGASSPDLSVRVVKISDLAQ